MLSVLRARLPRQCYVPIASIPDNALLKNPGTGILENAYFQEAGILYKRGRYRSRVSKNINVPENIQFNISFVSVCVGGLQRIIMCSIKAAHCPIIYNICYSSSVNSRG